MKNIVFLYTSSLLGEQRVLSHDLHLQSLQKCFEKYSSNSFHVLNENLWDTKSSRLDQNENFVFDYAFLSPYAIEDFRNVSLRIHAKIWFFSLPAIWWYEYPDKFPINLIYELRRVSHLQGVYIVVPNQRMADYLFRFFLLYENVDMTSRILITPYFATPHHVSARKSSDSIDLVDGGGLWRWTDMDTFVSAFCEYLVINPQTKIKLHLFNKAESNTDHDDYIESIIHKVVTHGFQANILIHEWMNTQEYNLILSKAHFGLHINKQTIEGFLSSRIRIQNYIEHDLPIISTLESSFAESWDSHFAPVQTGVKSYLSLFQELDHEIYENFPKINIQDFTNSIQSTFEHFIGQIENQVSEYVTLKNSKTLLEQSSKEIQLSLGKIVTDSQSPNIRRILSKDENFLISSIQILRLARLRRVARVVIKRAYLRFLR
jgi:hypothetical protein